MTTQIGNMISKVLGTKSISPNIALNLLKSLPGPVSNFITAASAAGYAGNKIYRTLHTANKNQAKEREKANLQSRAESGVATPREERRLSDKQETNFPQVGKAAGQIVAGLAGATLGSQSPGGTLGSIVEGVTGGTEEEPAQGLGTGEAPESTGNIIQETFPELASAVEQAISQQGNPLAAGQLLKSQGQHSMAIGVLEKRAGMKFPDLVASIYGQEQVSPEQGQEQVSGADRGLMDILSKLHDVLR